MNLSVSWTVTIINILLITTIVKLAAGKSVAQADEIDLTQYGSRLFGEPSKDVGVEVGKWTPDQKSGNPEELGSYFEGDILFPRGKSRNGLIAESFRWHDAQIPFEIVGDFSTHQPFFFLNIFSKSN